MKARSTFTGINCNCVQDEIMDSTDEQIVVLTKWGIKWVKFAYDYVVNGDSASKFAKKILTELDACKEEPEFYLDSHTFHNSHTVQDLGTGDSKVVVDKVLVKKKIKKGFRSKFSSAVANMAYNKFGERPMSEANLLVTRKWIQKLLEEPKYKDLRTCDKNLAIDRALFLSFVPTRSFQAMRLAMSTSVAKDRLCDTSVFGKAFRLCRNQEDL